MTAATKEGRVFVTVDGVTLHCRVDGPEPGPAVVFVNSLGSDLRIWDEVVRFLPDTYRILRYDKRGHGLSDTPQGPYRLEDHTRDLGLLLDRFGMQRVAVVGISVGGMIAMDLAAREPGRVDRLVLADTGTTIGTTESWNERI